MKHSVDCGAKALGSVRSQGLLSGYWSARDGMAGVRVHMRVHGGMVRYTAAARPV